MQRNTTSDGAGLLDDRGVSEVIGAILVFGLLVSLLAIVQTQAVPNANREVEVKHSADVQGDLANLQAAISRTSAFGGTESTTVETGMTYPPRLVLYNPPAVQGTLRTNDVLDARLGRFVAANPTANQNFNRYLQGATYPTSHLTYEAEYNRYQSPPTIRYEYGTLVSDYEDRSVVEAEGNLVNGNRISLTYLEGGVQESQVRPASLTTYPVSAPGRTVEVETGSVNGTLLLPTNIDEEAWVGKILTDQIDMNALPSEDVSTCAELNEINSSNPAATNDGRFIVGCEYLPGASGVGSDFLRLDFQTNSTYKMQMSKVGFSAATDDPPARYLVAEDALTESGNVTLQLFDQYNNPAAAGKIARAKLKNNGNVSSTVEQNYTASSNGEVTIEKPEGAKVYYISEGQHADVPNNGTSCVSSSACAVSTQFNTAGQSIRLADARITADDKVNLTLVNYGTSDRSIESISLNYATIHERKKVIANANTVTGIGNLLGTVLGVQFGETTASDIVNGPEAVTDLELKPVGGDRESGQLDPPAIENGQAQSVPEIGEIPARNVSSLVVVFEESIEADMLNDFGDSETPGDVLELSVTITYEDNYRTTYTTHLGQNDDVR